MFKKYFQNASVCTTLNTTQMFDAFESWHQKITDVLGVFKWCKNTDGEFLGKSTWKFLLISKYIFISENQGGI